MADKKCLIKNAQVINESQISERDVLIDGPFISRVDRDISAPEAEVIDAQGLWLMPGVIDDQVHFRQPGMEYKADIHSESRAAVAGGVTSFMEMPNTKPPALTQELLEQKYQIAERESVANYSFYMGVSNDNLEEVLKTNTKKNTICGIKIFMGSSTGNMLVDDVHTLEKIFDESRVLIATHCEDEARIKSNMEALEMEIPTEKWTAKQHPLIRDVEACYLSSSRAVELARKYDTRLHILHITTAKELELFEKDINFKDKRITSEVCVHHLSFSSSDYAQLGNQIKCNPAIKEISNQKALWEGLHNGSLDVIATDHAPHSWDEKEKRYIDAPAGVPLIQHSLLQMLEHAAQGKINLELLVQKMCHNPAVCFQLKGRGFVREGYFADLVLINPQENYTVDRDNILYKCGWSPYENHRFSHRIDRSFVNGNLVYENGQINESYRGRRLEFDRK